MATYTVSSSPWSGSVPNPVYSGTFIPQIWSGKVIEKFYDASVIPQMSNTNYEGEIKNMGDTVQIRSVPTITLAAYEAEMALAVTRPSVAKQTLEINKGHYWNTVLDDVMEIQSDINMMSMWAQDASEQLKLTVDEAVLDGVLNGPTATENRGVTAGRISVNINLGVTTNPVLLGTTDVLDLIVDMGTVLDEQNIPEGGRYIVVPAWVCGLIKKSDLKDASLSGDGSSILRNGRVGMIDRFELFVSNRLPNATQLTTGEFAIYAGHRNAITFASQLIKVETLRSEQTFGNLMRGLQVYGYKVIDPTAFCQAIVKAG